MIWRALNAIAEGVRFGLPILLIAVVVIGWVAAKVGKRITGG